MPKFILDSSPDLRLSELQRRAKLCRRLSTGAVPISVMQQLAVLAAYCESEAAGLKRQRK